MYYLEVKINGIYQYFDEVYIFVHYNNENTD